MRTLYDYPEEQPRLAALRAGAKLDDGLVVPHLIEMTTSLNVDVRRQAVELLGAMGIDPLIDQALRDLLDDEDVDVRLAAYEVLIQRADPHFRQQHGEHDAAGKDAHGDLRHDVGNQRDRRQHPAAGRIEPPLQKFRHGEHL